MNREKKGRYTTMKTTKIILIATIATIALIALCGIATATAEELPDFYPRLAVVVSCEETAENEWFVLTEDTTGNLWGYYEDSDSCNVGDLCILMIFNNGEDITTHEIVEVYYEGTLENLENFFEEIF
jgi:hypothetical protein